MGIPWFPFLHDFRDPVVIIGTPFSTQTATIQITRMLLVDTVRFENMSGAEWLSIKLQIYVGSIEIIYWTDGRFMLEIED